MQQSNNKIRNDIYYKNGEFNPAANDKNLGEKIRCCDKSDASKCYSKIKRNSYILLIVLLPLTALFVAGSVGGDFEGVEALFPLAALGLVIFSFRYIKNLPTIIKGNKEILNRTKYTKKTCPNCGHDNHITVDRVVFQCKYCSNDSDINFTEGVLGEKAYDNKMKETADNIKENIYKLKCACEKMTSITNKKWYYVCKNCGSENELETPPVIEYVDTLGNKKD